MDTTSEAEKLDVNSPPPPQCSALAQRSIKTNGPSLSAIARRRGEGGMVEGREGKGKTEGERGKKRSS